MLHVKSTFLNKICFLKILGKKLLLLQRVDNHIQCNINDIYQSYIKYHPRKQRGSKTLFQVIMADELEREDIEHAKKKLHSKMMDCIEAWLKQQAVKVRRNTISEVRARNDARLHFHMKNYFIDTGLEKHIRWYSRGRRFDMQAILVNEMNVVKKRSKELQVKQ